MRRYLLPFFCLILLFAACETSTQEPAKQEKEAPNKFSNPKVQQIYEFADLRNTDSLLPFLADQDANIRAEAAMAFGSVQDNKAIESLLPLLEEDNQVVSTAAAWALGQIGDSTNSDPIKQRILGASNANNSTLGAALGKSGTSEQINEVLMLQTSNGLPENMENAVMQMLYRAGLRGIVPQNASEFALKIMEEGDAEAKMYAAAYLGRIKKLGPIENFERLDFLMRNDQELAVQIQLVKAYRRCESEECTNSLRKIAMDENRDAQVRANAFSAAIPSHDLTEAAFVAVKSANAQLAVAAAEYLLNSEKAALQTLVSESKKVENWRARALLLRAAMRKSDYKSENLVVAQIDSLLEAAKSYEKGYLLAALSESPKYNDKIVEIVLAKEAIVSTLAAEGIVEQFDRLKKRDFSDRLVIIEKFIATEDPAIVAISADFLSKSDPVTLMQIKSVQFLEDAMAKMKLPEEIETYNGLEKAIATIQKRTPQPKTVDYQNPINWDLVKKIPKNQVAEIITNKGKIVFQLMVENCPGTVENFVQLVQDGFYNGKNFHRIVPSFVAQGGCPRGDGYGSSPDAIRSEWPNLHYGPGMVGMASAGKDTESCQWFITHCDTPHLDGRYTIFAKVVSGMEIVQTIEIGDQIERIELPGM